MTISRFAGQVALVTGASRGIGRSIALELGREGATVVIVHLHDDDAAAAVVAEITALGTRALAYAADVGKRVEAEAAVAEAVQLFGRLDVLVNNAGICPFNDIFAVTDDDWQRTIQTNLYGPFVMSQAAGRVMAAQGKGAIVNISSISSYLGAADRVHYCASKAGVNGLTAALAVALGPLGIRVNAVLPGGVHTDINRHQWEGQPEHAPGLPVNRLGQPLDMARAVCYLASDAAAWVTGVLLPVDGGTLISR